MTVPRMLPATAVLAALAFAPASTQARSHHHARPYGLPYQISYNHNYGPGPLPESFAYYDGPATVHCDQGAATYFGQDRRRHPCF